MARTKTQQSVSLFPFLAVLICTMGALILVLLLTTRQIREQVEQEALQEQLAAKVPAPELTGGPAEPAPRTAVASSDSVSQEDAVAAEAAARQPLPEQAVVDAEKEKRRAQIDATTLIIADARTELDALRNRISRATADREELARQHTDLIASTQELEGQAEQLEGPLDLEEQSERVMQLRQQLQARNAQKSEQSEELKALYGDLDEASETTRKAEQLLHRRESALIGLRELAEKAEQQPAVGTDATLIEFTNSSGTTQFPVIIELNSAGLVFQPSGVAIRTSDLEGFSPRESPLVAGILAAHNAQPSRSLMERPYALLLVRPEGSLAFYTAQRILRGAQIHFGYELLESDRKVAIETPAWEERSEIISAVESSMQRRQQLYGDLVNRINELKRQAAAKDGQRRLSVGPDGQLREQDERVADLLPGRFYAGGVAPPPGFQQRREQQRRSSQNAGGGPFPEQAQSPRLARDALSPSSTESGERTPQTGQLQPGENIVRLPATSSGTGQSNQELDRLLAILEENSTATTSDPPQFGDPTVRHGEPASNLPPGSGGSTVVNPFIASPQGPTVPDPSEANRAVAAISPGPPQQGSANSRQDFNQSAPSGQTSAGADQPPLAARAGEPAAAEPLATEEQLSPESTPLDWSNSVAAPTDSNSRTVAAAANEEFPSSPIAPTVPGAAAAMPQGAVTSSAPSATTRLDGSPNMTPGAGPGGTAPVDPALAALQQFLQEAEQKKADARPNRFLVDLMTGRKHRTVRVPVDVRLQGNLLQIGNLVAVDTSQMSAQQLLDATLNGINTQLSAMPDGGRTAVPVLDFYVDQVAGARLPALLRSLQQLDVPTRSIERTETPPGTFLELLKKNATLGRAAAPINVRPPQAAQGRIRL
ncbi:MAG: hypothetical protein NXI04_27105 [Planctomycetaceae bacterium]|nr:hypothetical protein [Planctomycetaceae bacterium]